MARIRTLKPEFFQDEDLANCSPHARLLAIALLQLCDANGVFRHIPMQIHAHAFPWEAEVNTQALLKELHEVGYAYLYRVDGKEYGLVPGFCRHQRLQGRESQSEGQYPLPSQGDSNEEAAGKQQGSSGEYPSASSSETGTGNREQGTRGTGERGNEARKRATQATQIPEDFEPSTKLIQWAQANTPAVDPWAEAGKFVDYHRAKGSTFKDHQAAFRNWLRKAAEFQQERKPSKGEEVEWDIAD